MRPAMRRLRSLVWCREEVIDVQIRAFYLWDAPDSFVGFRADFYFRSDRTLSPQERAIIDGLLLVQCTVQARP